MKRFTIFSSILIVVIFAAAVAYVLAGPEFELPNTVAVPEGEDPNDPVWSMTLDDLTAYLAEKGLIDPASKAEEIHPDPNIFVWNFNGAALYWWDLEKIDRDDEGYEQYLGYKNDGVYVFPSGVAVTVTINGPFGLRYSSSSSSYDGDVDALLEAFRAFGRE